MKTFVKVCLLIAISMTLFSGCTEDCDHDFAAVDTYYVSILPEQWQKFDAGGFPYLYAEVRCDLIDNYVIDNGVVVAYLIEAERANQLPYILPWGVNDYNEPYSQVVRYDIEPGFITFVIEASDIQFPAPPINPMTFKVSVIQNYTH